MVGIIISRLLCLSTAVEGSALMTNFFRDVIDGFFGEEREYTLLFKSSRDGPLSSKFHEKCDHKGETLTLIRPKDLREIFGGYNPLPWKKAGGMLGSILWEFIL
jgi:hypothetical protein